MQGNEQFAFPPFVEMLFMLFCLHCSGPDMSSEDPEEAEKVGNMEIYFIPIRQLFNAHALSHTRTIGVLGDTHQ